MKTRWTLAGLATLIALTALARPARAYLPVEFQGGPVISPVIYPIFWGPWTSAEITTNIQYLNGVAAYLSGAPTRPGNQVGLEPVTRQYGVIGAVVGGSLSVSGNGVPVVTDASVHNEIHLLQSQGKLPPNGPNRLFVMFLKGFNYDFSSEDNPCAYHDQDGGTYYAAIPSLCPLDLISHEVMEAVTDPDRGGGWLTSEYLGFRRAEGADECQNFARNPLTFGNVQSFADNRSSSCQSFIPSTTPHFAVTKVAGHVLDVVWPTPTPATLAHAWFDGSTWQSETMTAPTSQTALNFIGPPAVVSASPNRIDVFARDVNGQLLHVFKDFNNSNGWTWTVKLPIGIGPPSAASYGTNRIDLAFMNQDASTGHSWSNDGGNSFSTERWQSRITGSVKIVALADSKLDVYVYGSDLRFSVNAFDNGWYGFQVLGSTPGYTAVPPGVASSDVWYRRVVLLEMQTQPLGIKLETHPFSLPSGAWPFMAATPSGNSNWGALDVVGDTQGLDAVWQDRNTGTFYWSHYDMTQANAWNWIDAPNRWGSRVSLGGVYASPPVIARGGDGKLIVTGIGLDGCLWFTTIVGSTINGPSPTNQCGLF